MKKEIIIGPGLIIGYILKKNFEGNWFRRALEISFYLIEVVRKRKRSLRLFIQIFRHEEVQGRLAIFSF